MRKVNINDVEELVWTSPKGKYAGAGRQISEALGRDPRSTDLMQRHPFDVEIQRLSPGKSACPYHSHSVQWEFYHVISGRGVARHEGGVTNLVPGDAILFKPNEAHEIAAEGPEDLIMFVVADNPMGESCYYPDSNKVSVIAAERLISLVQPVAYHYGEE